MKKLVITLTKTEHEEFEAHAKEHGLSLHEWAKRRLAGKLLPAPAVLDEAFRQLDVSDQMRELSGKPLPPQVTPPEQRLVHIGKRIPSSHSCVHFAHVLRDDGGAPFVCTSSAQFGRPCYFGSSGAVDCSYFSPRLAR